MSEASGSELGSQELAQRLNAALGPALVAALAGARDSGAPRAWEKRGGAAPQAEQTRRLSFAYGVWQQLAKAESEGITRAWFIGGNPFLGEVTPLTAIREDRFDEVRAAAQARVDDDFDA